MLIAALIVLVLAELVAAVALWRITARRQRAREAELSAAVSKLAHDLRGALTPVLLLAERLESSDDPAVRQAGLRIAQAADRATALGRKASSDAKQWTERG
jgi:signal transduction histidine kinase